MSFGRASYHHGNLRETLLEVARRLIVERGLGGFSFAELARAAGVSPAAPYRHFRDRNAVVGEIARVGFERLEKDLRLAWNHGLPDQASAIERCGRAFLGYARADPAAYAAMFDTTPGEADPAVRRASDDAYAVIRMAADAICAKAPGRPPASMVALHIWSLCHGIANLYVGTASPGRRNLPMSAEDLLDAGLMVYLRSVWMD